MEFNSIPLNFLINSLHFLHHFLFKFSYLWSHPLFSAFVALYTLILLYVPSCFLRILLSPVLNTTMIILISLLRLGVNERPRKEYSFQNSRILDHSVANEKLESRVNLTLYSSLVLESSSMEQRFLDYPDKNQTHVESKAEMDLDLESNQTHAEAKPICGLDLGYDQIHTKFKHDLGSEYNDHHKWELLDANSMESSEVVNEGDARIEKGSKQQVDTMMKILEWNMKAPLEIIYEAYEGEEEEEEDVESNENNVVSSNKLDVGCEKYPFLLMYYPESETDSSSDDDFPMKEKWDETHDQSVFLKWEEEDDDREELIEISLDRYGKRSFDFCHADQEDNLIEIDIFPTRN